MSGPAESGRRVLSACISTVSLRGTRPVRTPPPSPMLGEMLRDWAGRSDEAIAGALGFGGDPFAPKPVVDYGFTVPGQAWTYWNKGPGPGEEVYLTTDETEWSNSTGEAAAQNLHAVAHALSVNPMSAPPS